MEQKDTIYHVKWRNEIGSVWSQHLITQSKIEDVRLHYSNCPDIYDVQVRALTQDEINKMSQRELIDILSNYIQAA